MRQVTTDAVSVRLHFDFEAVPEGFLVTGRASGYIAGITDEGEAALALTESLRSMRIKILRSGVDMEAPTAHAEGHQK